MSWDWMPRSAPVEEAVSEASRLLPQSLKGEDAKDAM